MTVLVAIRPLRAACNDGRRIAEPQFQEVHIDHKSQVFRRKALAVVVQDAVRISSCARYGLACHSHGVFSGTLCAVQPFHFLRVLGAARKYAHAGVVFKGNSSLAQVIGEDQWQRAVGNNQRDLLTAQAFRHGLRGGSFAIARQPTRGFKVTRTRHRVGPGVLSRTTHLNIPHDEHTMGRLAVRQKVNACRRITNSKANRVKQTLVHCRNAGDKSGGRHGEIQRESARYCSRRGGASAASPIRRCRSASYAE